VTGTLTSRTSCLPNWRSLCDTASMMAVRKISLGEISRRGDQLASGSLHRRARIGVEWVGDVCMRKRAFWIFFFSQ